MKYLKYFEEASAYEAYKNGSDFVLPNVSYVEDGNIYYNPLNTFLSQFSIDVSMLSEVSETLKYEWMSEEDSGASKCKSFYEHFKNGTYNNKSLTNSTICFYDVNEETGVISETPHVLFSDGERVEFSKEEPLYKWATQPKYEGDLNRMYKIQIGEHLNSYLEEDFAGVITQYNNGVYYDEVEGILRTDTYGDGAFYFEDYFSTISGYYSNID